MSRAAFRLLALGIALTLLVSAQKTDKPSEQPQEVIPPEEDEAVKPTVYEFNPLQATKELKVGNYYFKKGSFRAAALRFEEATKWDPGNAEAYLRLAQARERQKDKKGAREAYSKYLELVPDARNADEIRKKIANKDPG